MRDIEGWIEQLLANLEGAGLPQATAVLHGSAARGHYLPGWSDVNLLLILDRLGLEELHLLGPVLAAWVQQAEAMPLLFTRAEWARAADAYPLEIAEMRTGYRVIRGADPLASVTVQPLHLRLALEREFRGKLLRLRLAYAVADPGAGPRADDARSAISSLLVLFRGLLVLAGQAPPAEAASLVRATAALAGFDAEPLVRSVTGREQSGWKPGREDLAGLLTAVERAAAYVDHFTQGEST